MRVTLWCGFSSAQINIGHQAEDSAVATHGVSSISYVLVVVVCCDGFGCSIAVMLVSVVVVAMRLPVVKRW